MFKNIKTAEQLASEAAAAAAAEELARADWRGFLGAMRQTTVFAQLRGQARADVGANALATELRTVLGEAALGMAEIEAIQGLVDELLPTLTPAQVAEIEAGITAFNVPLTTS